MAARRRTTKRQPARRKKGRRGGKGALAGWLRRAAVVLGNGWLMVTAGAAVGVVAIALIASERHGNESPPVAPTKPSQTAAAPAPAPAPIPAPPAPAASPAPSPPPTVEPATEPSLAALPAPPPAIESGPPTWLRNAVAVPDTGSRPIIAIVIDDLGLNRVNTARVSDLPGPLTMAFLTYAGDLRRQTAAAHRAGHELMVHMAMEPLGESVDPGPDALHIAAPPGQLMAQLRHNLDAFDGYVGINNHMGSRFTASEPEMRLVLAELKSRGLLFLDSRTTAESVGAAVATQLDVPFAERDVFLDNVQSADAVEARLAEVERIARSRGQAIAIGHPHDATIAALAAWLPTLQARGFALVPLSAIVKRKLGETG
jgi:polysaccharide deacetylase 2 family uncharacterized protein YibQ